MYYIYIDESGVGKKDGISTIALVYLHFEDIEKVDKAVVNIERKMKIQYFHWAHAAWNVRKQFITAISKESFFAKVAIIRNPFIGSLDLERTLINLIVEKDIEIVTIDGKKSKSYERKIKKILKLRMIQMNKLRTGNDHGYPALRVADAIAGLVRYVNEHKNVKDAVNLYNLIQMKIRIIIGSSI